MIQKLKYKYIYCKRAIFNFFGFYYIKKLICYIFGHKYDNIALEHGYLYCQRCFKDAHYDEDLEGEEFHNWWSKKTWKIKQKFRDYKWKIRNWWKYKVRKEDDSVPF